MRRLLVAVALLVFGVALTQATPAPSASPFQLVIDHEGQRWTAECAEGCNWTRVSYACAGACSVIVDSRGIASALDVPHADVTFAVKLDRTAEGWTATGLSGTAWSKLTWGCGGLRSCKARVDASGVGRS